MKIIFFLQQRHEWTGMISKIFLLKGAETRAVNNRCK